MASWQGKPIGSERHLDWQPFLDQARIVKVLLLDVDGILTDGSIIYTADNTEIKAFHIQDGLGLKLLQMAGIETGLITARRSEMVRRRAEELGITHIFQGVENKLKVFQELLVSQGLQAEETAYMGDDWLDLPLLTRVGFSATVVDAVPEVKQVVHYITSRSGGKGAVREVCDLLLEAKGKRQELLGRFLS
jgi:3-deoxy-D-manno-octulosonate 8-phosphate phosphatase (KDO 8-P phosphatase)